MDSLSGRRSRSRIIEIDRSASASGIDRPTEYASIGSIECPSGSRTAQCGDEEHIARLMEIYPEGEIPPYEFPQGC